MVDSPILGRWQVARSLRRHRLAASLTIADVAANLECSPAKVSRMETGAVGVRIQDLREILELLKVDEDERAELMAQVRNSKRKGWWHEFSDVCPPNSETLFGLEDAAATIRLHSPSLVPGLLQTPGYASALIRSSGDAAEVCDKRLTLRMRRQRVLRRSDAPQMHVLLDEAVLHRQIGGLDIMVEQLKALVNWTESATVNVRVVPLACGAHAAMGVAFSIFDFTEAPGSASVVYNEQLTHNVYIDDTLEVSAFTAAWASASEEALSSEQSRELIQRSIHRLRVGGTAHEAQAENDDRLPTPRAGSARLELNESGATDKAARPSFGHS